MGTPVEIEYALNFSDNKQEPTLYLLQLKPLIHPEDHIKIDLSSIKKEACFLLSCNCMGNGRDLNIHSIVWVDPRKFQRGETLEIAAEIEELDSFARKENFDYLLIGPGRWGTRDRWLGVPVSFDQISHARVIVEMDLPGFVVDSSLGSHFFHNLTTMHIKYMKITQGSDEDFIDLEWLYSLEPRIRTKHCVLTELKNPLDMRFDGRNSKGAIFKSSEAGNLELTIKAGN